jgi:glycosyltransferase involved in cell wall biosynthesis
LPEWSATIAGGGDIEKYQAIAGDLGLGETTRFVGWVDQHGAEKLLKQADVMVLPSYDEGLPLVVLEALGAGTPVICTSVGAIPEVLQDGVDVVFVNPGDREALSRALATLVASAETRTGFSTRGLAKYHASFTIECFLTSLFAVYEKRCGVALKPKYSAPTGENAG